MTRIAIIYYSATGNVHALAKAVALGARDAGAEVRLRRAPELAPDEAIDSNPQWRAHVNAAHGVPEVNHDDLRWADGYALGTPTRFGNVSAQLKQFLDTTGPLWAAGNLADKAGTAFTSAINAHGGNESTLLALYNTMHHWGAIIVPPGYTHRAFSAAGGNPYGTAFASGGGAPDADVLTAAHEQGARLTRIAALLRPNRSGSNEVAPADLAQGA